MNYFEHHTSDRAELVQSASRLNQGCRIVVYVVEKVLRKFQANVLASDARNESKNNILSRIFWTPEEVLAFCLAVRTLHPTVKIDIRGTPLINEFEGALYSALKPHFSLNLKWSQKRGRKVRLAVLERCLLQDEAEPSAAFPSALLE